MPREKERNILTELKRYLGVTEGDTIEETLYIYNETHNKPSYEDLMEGVDTNV